MDNLQSAIPFGVDNLLFITTMPEILFPFALFSCYSFVGLLVPRKSKMERNVMTRASCHAQIHQEIICELGDMDVYILSE